MKSLADTLWVQYFTCNMTIKSPSALLANLVSSLDIPMAVFTRSGVLRYQSEPLQAETGFTPENIDDLLSWFTGDKATLDQLRSRILSLEHLEKFTTRLKHFSNGSAAREYDLHAMCICDEEPVSLVVRVEPAARESMLFARIEGLERLAMVGQVAAGVAHEFNNILTAMLGWTQIAARTVDGNEKASFALTTIENNTKRAKQIASELLDLSRPTPAQTQLVPIANIVEESLRLLSWELNSARIQLSHTIEDVGYCDCDTTRLLQVFVNIIRNALEATPSGGSLSVEVKETDEGAAISFTDSGNGIPEAILENIFDPFFTTKVRTRDTSAGGSGLGLAISKRIIEEHGGRIFATSRRPGGTTITVTLPLGRASQVDMGVAGETRSSFPPGISVLVVDDELDIGEMIRTALTLRGAHVEVASSGEEALSLCARESFHAAFVDFSMSGLSGHELGHALAEAQPSLPIVFMSGVEIPQGGTPNMHDFLKKPFDLHEIQCKLREVLDA